MKERLVASQVLHGFPERSPSRVIDEVTVDSLSNQIPLAANRGRNNRKTRGVSLLNRLPKSLFSAGVNKDVHCRVGIREFIAGEATGESDGIAGESILQLRAIRTIADNHDAGVRNPTQLNESANLLLWSKSTHVTNKALALWRPRSPKFIYRTSCASPWRKQLEVNPAPPYLNA